MTQKKVMIVDDHPFFIHGLERYLTATGKYEIRSALSVAKRWSASKVLSRIW